MTRRRVDSLAVTETPLPHLSPAVHLLDAARAQASLADPDDHGSASRLDAAASSIRGRVQSGEDVPKSRRKKAR